MLQQPSDYNEVLQTCSQLGFTDWMELARLHSGEVSKLTDGYVNDKSHQIQNPVMDFMFTYYQFRPAKLKKWTPGAFTFLESAKAEHGFDPRYFTFTTEGAIADMKLFPAKKIRGLRWITALLEFSAARQPNFGCCGLHEWAMVYGADEVRHEKFPLRLSSSEIKDLVDSKPVTCTHFDAFRFFTPAAQPKNAHKLSRESMHDMEQPGCLHTNMDLYKWCYKLTPWVPSSLTLQAFKVACKARELDMQAGPYDLRSIGFEPVCIETDEGRRIYKKRQAAIYDDARPVRQALLYHLRQMEQVLTSSGNEIPVTETTL
ncbi:MAG: 3-methyladenine DNA glycosylase [Balneolales bacterium]|nr:3-methyladenine DNA glycosylase [Balneolales bacterium]